MTIFGIGDIEAVDDNPEKIKSSPSVREALREEHSEDNARDLDAARLRIADKIKMNNQGTPTQRREVAEKLKDLHASAEGRGGLFAEKLEPNQRSLVNGSEDVTMVSKIRDHADRTAKQANLVVRFMRKIFK